MKIDKSILSESDWDSAQYYPGLVNISGTYCFMNSTLQVRALLFITFTYMNLKTLQALASLTYLQPQIDAIYAKAESLDVPTPVIDALHELFNGTCHLSSTSSHSNIASHRTQHPQILLSFSSTAWNHQCPIVSLTTACPLFYLFPLKF